MQIKRKDLQEIIKKVVLETVLQENDGQINSKINGDRLIVNNIPLESIRLVLNALKVLGINAGGKLFIQSSEEFADKDGDHVFTNEILLLGITKAGLIATLIDGAEDRVKPLSPVVSIVAKLG